MKSGGPSAQLKFKEDPTEGDTMCGSAQTVHDVDSVEHEAVVEFLAAVIREAYRKAEMVASLCGRLRRNVPKPPADSLELADDTSETDRLSASGRLRHSGQSASIG